MTILDDDDNDDNDHDDDDDNDDNDYDKADIDADNDIDEVQPPLNWILRASIECQNANSVWMYNLIESVKITSM